MTRFNYEISARQLAMRAGLCYTHALKVLNGDIQKPQLETMLLLDEALEQLTEDEDEDEEEE